VDVATVLTDMAAKQPQELDWRHSVVDLMKLLGLDSGLQARGQLAQELGYAGDTGDSAAMTPDRKRWPPVLRIRNVPSGRAPGRCQARSKPWPNRTPIAASTRTMPSSSLWTTNRG
jgi:hypothetical protein